MSRKDGLNVNSTMKEFKEAVKKERLTLQEAQLIGLLAFDEYQKQKDRLHLLCRVCFKKRKVHYKKSFDEYKKELETHVDELGKLCSRFYPYIKYDW